MRRPLGISIVGGLILSASCSRCTRRRSSISISTGSGSGAGSAGARPAGAANLMPRGRGLSVRVPPHAPGTDSVSSPRRRARACRLHGGARLRAARRSGARCIQGGRRLEAGAAQGRSAAGPLVERVRRSGVGRPRGASRHLEPEHQARRGPRAPGARADAAGARRLFPDRRCVGFGNARGRSGR